MDRVRVMDRGVVSIGPLAITRTLATKLVRHLCGEACVAPTPLAGCRLAKRGDPEERWVGHRNEGVVVSSGRVASHIEQVRMLRGQRKEHIEHATS